MDKDRFNALLADIDQITDEDIRSLNQLRKKYPYFQDQYVMIARALKKRHHPKADAFIKKAAIYSADRGLLKSIIMEEFSTPIPSLSEPETSAGQPPKTHKKAQDTPTAGTKKEVKTAPQVSPKPPAKSQDKVNIAAESKTIEPKPVPASVPSWQSTPPAETGDNKQLISDLEKDLREIREKKKLIAKMLEQSDAKAPVTKVSSSEKKSAKPRKKSQSELIEKFIQNEPQMEKQKLVSTEDDNTQEDLSAKNIKESEDFHTETLAKLMIKQKKYKKAIQIYEKLGLKFPEKRTYFASQIEKVNNRRNV